MMKLEILCLSCSCFLFYLVLSSLSSCINHKILFYTFLSLELEMLAFLWKCEFRNNSEMICAILFISYLIFYAKNLCGISKASFLRGGVQTSGLHVIKNLMTIFSLNAAG